MSRDRPKRPGANGISHENGHKEGRSAFLRSFSRLTVMDTTSMSRRRKKGIPVNPMNGQREKERFIRGSLEFFCSPLGRAQEKSESKKKKTCGFSIVALAFPLGPTHNFRQKKDSSVLNVRASWHRTNRINQQMIGKKHAHLMQK